MPTLPTKSFAQIVSDTIVGIQGRAAKLLSFRVGSTLRAIVEGFAGTFLWFEALVLQLLTAIRLSTSSGIDVDTFVSDFMPIPTGTTSPRLGAQAASGLVTVSQFTPNANFTFIPVGATFITADGSQEFAVTADPTFSTWTATPIPGGYNLLPFVGAIDVPVQNTVPGAAGNIQAGAISLQSSPITGVDAVTNVAKFDNGTDQESDIALKKRFSVYILGLSRGDVFGLQAAIEALAVTVQSTLTEDYNYDGSFRAGYFFVVADDGSGAPSPDFLQNVTNAVYSVRPLGIQCAVFPPIIIWATVSMSITTATGFVHTDVIAAVSANIATNINGLGLGNELPWSILAGWAYAIPGVTKVANVQLNGQSGDNADLVTTKQTQDGLASINFATVKCLSVNIF